MLLRSALTIASRGLHVHPCLPRDKRPATARGCLDATDDAEQIRAWWRHEPQYNIAIATGSASKIFAIDVDSADAEAELRKLEAEHGALPATVEVITARGRHIYFQMPDSPLRNSAGKIAPGIDIRANGGYVLAPPSIHPSGRAYAWSVDTAKTFAAAPDWLLTKITDPITGNGAKAPTPPSQWRTLMADGVDEGQRDDAATRLAGYLLRHRLDVIVVLETLRLWNAERCRPPLPAQDIERIVNSIAGKELKRRGHG
jgi:hypothetical protein